jgi:hypothetical protein
VRLFPSSCPSAVAPCIALDRLLPVRCTSPSMGSYLLHPCSHLPEGEGTQASVSPRNDVTKRQPCRSGHRPRFFSGLKEAIRGPWPTQSQVSMTKPQ